MGRSRVDDGGIDSYMGSAHFVRKNIWGSPGGKMRLAKVILKLLTPAHSAYTEVFAGSAAVFFRKEKVATEVLNDFNEEIAAAYSAIQTLSDADLDVLEKMPWTGDRKTFNTLYAADPKSLGKVGRLHRWLYITRFSFGIMPQAGFNPSSQGMQTQRTAKVRKYRDRLAGVSVYTGDYVGPLMKHDGADSLHFLDPPYPGYNARLREKDFDEDGFLETIKGLKGHFLITYGIRGRFPVMVKDTAFHRKRICPRRSFGQTGNMGAGAKLGTLIVTNYEQTTKSMGLLEDYADVVVCDWTSDDDAICEMVNDSETYRNVDCRPPADMAMIAKLAIASDIGRLHGDGPVLSLAKRIAEREPLEHWDILKLANYFASSGAPEMTPSGIGPMLLGGGAGKTWAGERVQKMVEVEGSVGSNLVEVGGASFLNGPLMVAEDAVVMGPGGELVLRFADDMVEDAVSRCLPVPTEAVVNKTAVGHHAYEHIPLYDLVLVPSGDFGVVRRLEKMIGDFDYRVGDSGTASIQLWEQGEVVVTKVMMRKMGKRPDDHWQGGTLLSPLAKDGADRLDQMMADGSGIVTMVSEVTKALGAPGSDDKVHRGSLKVLEPFAADPSVVMKSTDGKVVSQLDVVKWVAGEQEEGFKEFFFDGDKMSGRYVFMRVPSDLEVVKAVWSRSYVDDLPDSAFLWVAPGGKKSGGKTTPRDLRYFPFRDDEGEVDVPHLRNALARIPQAKHELLTAAKVKELTAKAEKYLAAVTAKGADTWVVAKFAEHEPHFVTPNPLAKRATTGGPSFEVVKALEEQRIVLGPVLIPETVDLQGDIISSEAIEKAAHDWLAGINVTSKTGLMHKDFDRAFLVVESYVAPVDFTVEGRKILKGTWMAAFKILDDETWESVKKGELRGFSIGGTASETEKLDG